MFENIYEIYDPEMVVFRKAKKKTYEERITAFRETFGHYIDELLTYVSEAEDKEAAAAEAGAAISASIYDHFAKRGRIITAKKADMSLFMIFYVFPSILMTGSEDAKVAADGLLKEWSEKFDCPNMGYTTYEELRESFREKIFGLF